MEEKLELLQKGSHKAFEWVFDTYYEPLCRYAYSIIRDSNDAQDIVQKVFYKLWDQHEELEIKTSLKSYLYRMVHNESLNQAQQKKNRSEINYSIVSENGTSHEDVSEFIHSSELQTALTNVIGNLAPKCREAFEMSRLQQKSYAEIAQKMNISVNTVENHISKALRQLRIALNDFLLFLALIFNVI